jgi:hypothetical protein
MSKKPKARKRSQNAGNLETVTKQPKSPQQPCEIVVDLSKAVLGLRWPQPITFKAARRDLRALLLTLSVLRAGNDWEEEDDTRAYAIFEEEYRVQWCELWPMLDSKTKIRKRLLDGLWRSLGGDGVEVVERRASIPSFLRMKQCLELGQPGFEIFVNSELGEVFGLLAPPRNYRKSSESFCDW